LYGITLPGRYCKPPFFGFDQVAVLPLVLLALEARRFGIVNVALSPRPSGRVARGDRAEIPDALDIDLAVGSARGGPAARLSDATTPHARTRMPANNRDRMARSF
jgi:hypothetical protein